MAALDFGKLIRKRRQALGMKQDDLAKAVGVDRSAVSNWERSQHFPLRYQGKLEEVLDISLDEDDADLPRIVADNQHDPRVMEIWGMKHLARSTKLAHIAYLLEREGPVRQPGTVTNGRPEAR